MHGEEVNEWMQTIAIGFLLQQNYQVEKVDEEVCGMRAIFGFTNGTFWASGPRFHVNSGTDFANLANDH